MALDSFYRLTKRMIALQLSWGDNCKKVL